MAETMSKRIQDIVSTALAEERREGMFSRWDPRATTRAILTAMREPTDAMLDQGAAKLDSGEFVPPYDVWTVMIDAALAEQT